MEGMKRVAAFIVAGCCLLGGSSLHAAETPTNRAVLPPLRRLEALKVAAKVLAPREPTWKTATSDLPDPYFRTNFVPPPTEEVVEPVVQDTRSDLELLRLAADQIRPTGIMMVEGENYLLMGGKRHKTGAVLPIAIDGIIYQITITAIEGKSYSLRLNEQELQQQLK
jgi:hypothetical protein